MLDVVDIGIPTIAVCVPGLPEAYGAGWYGASKGRRGAGRGYSPLSQPVASRTRPAGPSTATLRSAVTVLDANLRAGREEARWRVAEQRPGRWQPLGSRGPGAEQRRGVGSDPQHGELGASARLAAEPQDVMASAGSVARPEVSSRLEAGSGGVRA